VTVCLTITPFRNDVYLIHEGGFNPFTHFSNLLH
jgi:hypothetical protein